MRRGGKVKRLPYMPISCAVLVVILFLSVSLAVAGQVTIVPSELEVQKAGTILTVSSRFLATNHSDQPVMGVTVYAASGSAVSIGDIPPRGEAMSPPIIFALDLGGFNGRNFAFPVTVQYYEGQSGQLMSAQASFSCQIPEE